MVPGKTQLHQLTTAALVEEALCRKEGMLSCDGAFVVQTGKYTGRSPNDKFTVQTSETEKTVWWNKNNQAMKPETAQALYDKVMAYLAQEEVFIQDLYAGASPTHRLKVRVVTQRAWHGLFARNMFIVPKEEELTHFEPEFTVIQAPGFKADPTRDGTRSEAAVVLDFANKRVIVCGTEYAGEVKKSVFTALNYLLPAKGVLGMHCSANLDDAGHVAIFFGLSGTGKTTLSADPKRHLIGDDEHGWDDEGVFNFEGGCYAKVIRLSAQDEPEIFATTREFGTVLENVVINPQSRQIDLNDDRYTENTRASYSIEHIPNAYLKGMAGHPQDIIMLTCDAFGVLPPIAKMTSAQAMYHFISGYTAKVAGTERGVTEPQAVFSACFGAPFMARHPSVYAHLLGDKIAKHQVRCWLVNTGWSGGPYGVGSRMKIKWTRRLLEAALSGELDKVAMDKHPLFHFEVPRSVEGVPSEILNARETWADKTAYDTKATELVKLFRANFEQYAGQVSQEVLEAEPAL